MLGACTAVAVVRRWGTRVCELMYISYWDPGFRDNGRVASMDCKAPHRDATVGEIKTYFSGNAIAGLRMSSDERLPGGNLGEAQVGRLSLSVATTLTVIYSPPEKTTAPDSLMPSIDRLTPVPIPCWPACSHSHTHLTPYHQQHSGSSTLLSLFQSNPRAELCRCTAAGVCTRASCICVEVYFLFFVYYRQLANPRSMYRRRPVS